MHLYFNGPRSVFLQDISLQPEWRKIDPSYSTDLSVKPRIARVSFGDGYEQRAPDGINANKLVYQVVFLRRRKEIADALEKFFEGRKVYYLRTPSEYFWWTPPAPHDLKPLKFVCLEWQIKFEEFNSYTTTATFEQVFDPG